MCSKNSLVNTTDKNFKERINDIGTEPNVLKESITPPIAKNSIETVNKTEKSQASRRKWIHPAAINITKLNHWINQGLLKELKHKTW